MSEQDSARSTRLPKTIRKTIRAEAFNARDLPDDSIGLALSVRQTQMYARFIKERNSRWF